MQVWNVLLAARCKYRTQKSRHLDTTAQLLRAISSQLRHVSTIGKNLLSSNTSSTCPYNVVNFGPVAAEILSLVWGTPGNFNGFRILAALLHGTLVVGVSQTLRHWTEGATYIRQGGHHVGHWPTFLVWFETSVCGLLNCLIGFFLWIVWMIIRSILQSWITEVMLHWNRYVHVVSRGWPRKQDVHLL